MEFDTPEMEHDFLRGLYEWVTVSFHEEGLRSADYEFRGSSFERYCVHSQGVQHEALVLENKEAGFSLRTLHDGERRVRNWARSVLYKKQPISRRAQAQGLKKLDLGLAITKSEPSHVDEILG